MSSNKTTIKPFTPQEEAYIQAEVKAYLERVRQAEIEAEIRNRILDAERQQPGKRYY